MAAEERVHHPLAARLIERTMRQGERRGQAEHRRRLLAGLAGRVVELGAGSGINFRHYPVSVAEVVAVEPEAGAGSQRLGKAVAAHEVPRRFQAACRRQEWLHQVRGIGPRRSAVRRPANQWGRRPSPWTPAPWPIVQGRGAAQPRPGPP